MQGLGCVSLGGGGGGEGFGTTEMPDFDMEEDDLEEGDD